MTLAGLAIICSREWVKQNSKYEFKSENLFILRLQIYISVTKKVAFLGLKDISVAECVMCVVGNLQSRLYQEVYIKYQLELVWI